MLRQQGLDPGAPEGDRQGGVQAGSARPAGPHGQQVPGGSSDWSAGSILRATLSLQCSPEDAHPEDAHPEDAHPGARGVRSLPGRLPAGHHCTGGMRAGAGSSGSGCEAPRQGISPRSHLRPRHFLQPGRRRSPRDARRETPQPRFPEILTSHNPKQSPQRSAGTRCCPNPARACRDGPPSPDAAFEKVP